MDLAETEPRNDWKCKVWDKSKYTGDLFHVQESHVEFFAAEGGMREIIKSKCYLNRHLLCYLQDIRLAICLKFNLRARGCKMSHGACGVKSSQISAEPPVRISDLKVCFQAAAFKSLHHGSFLLFFSKTLFENNTTCQCYTFVDRTQACWETLIEMNRFLWDVTGI